MQSKYYSSKTANLKKKKYVLVVCFAVSSVNIKLSKKITKIINNKTFKLDEKSDQKKIFEKQIFPKIKLFSSKVFEKKKMFFLQFFLNLPEIPS